MEGTIDCFRDQTIEAFRPGCRVGGHEDSMTTLSPRSAFLAAALQPGWRRKGVVIYISRAACHPVFCFVAARDVASSDGMPHKALD